jgi:hypothetical protein
MASARRGNGRARWRGPAVVLVSVLGAAACAQGKDDVQSADADADAEADPSSDCAEPRMIEGRTPESMDDLFAWSDVVAEVSVLRVYETVGSQLEDELIVKRMADVRVDVPYKGTTEGATLVVYTAMEISNPRTDVPAGLVGEANVLSPGEKALVNFTAGPDEEYEPSALFGGVLVLDSGQMSMPGRPVCVSGSSTPPENLFRDRIETTTVTELRSELAALAASAP